MTALRVPCPSRGRGKAFEVFVVVIICTNQSVQ
jgi:hypothetical protein